MSNQQAAAQLLVRTVFIVIAMVVISGSARSTHFGDSNQVNQDQEAIGNLVDSGLAPIQLEMLAQRFSDYNQIPPIPAAWDRLVRAPEVKRQGRYRQCYFNPVSCFRK